MKSLLPLIVSAISVILIAISGILFGAWIELAFACGMVLGGLLTSIAISIIVR